MADIALVFNDYGGGDIALSGKDLLIDNGLESAVLVSLFTDRRVRADQLQPGDDPSDLRGYWGDIVVADTGDQTGSLLWLLRREKQTAQTLSRAKTYCEQALDWMVADKVAASVTVETAYLSRGIMGIGITIAQPGGSRVQCRYDYEWAAESAKRAA